MKPIPLFDLGNVVVKVDFSPFFSWLTERSEFHDLEKARGVVHSSLWSDFEFGDLSREQFAARLKATYRAEFTQNELEESFCAIFPSAVEGMVELLGELASRGPVYCLSNTNVIHLSWLKAHRPEVLRYFTRVFTSFELRQRKPFPAIYNSVAEELRVNPAEIVFFDDLGANVEGALSAGLDAHLFSDTGQVRQILKELRITDDGSR